jgi:drug/metabolite transporter (DMT)-like permease
MVRHRAASIRNNPHDANGNGASTAQETSMLPLATVLFGSGAAIFYVAATPIAKSLGSSPYLIVIPVVIATVALGAWLQTGSVRPRRLRRIVAAVLALEIVAVLALAAFFSDALTVRELGGAVAAFSGLALIGMQGGRAS